LVVATQRPSVNVITGVIKANIPARVSFAVTSRVDSQTILDQAGAERLLGNGDMLFSSPSDSFPHRLQGIYVSDNEINSVTSFLKKQAFPNYDDKYYEVQNASVGGGQVGQQWLDKMNGKGGDSLYEEVKEYVISSQKASTSLLQRRFGIGYNRASRLIDTLEENGVIGPINGAKPREVYIKQNDSSEE